ncbi:hypothetical protein AMAG_03127 [Allomyces macrogynus ATCC 38327]|uniref:Uncharacterized protein n=1 Tax=Allomyces macrogynus (strain ATCC 38327) TaxID=578462 RepID=A0A0L0S4G9_ALLM3|nr:hypothetical protein AMAG_03127 [Allomyces macrogynus ATCC 38327]|eukprot:KNE57407.1 hypothetical protein AMAG_03127 [Allomyces macrogynus ATCC 38327]
MINGAPSTAPATASPTRTAAVANPPSPLHAIPGTSVQASAPVPTNDAAAVPSSPPRPPSPPAAHDDADDDHDYAMAEAVDAAVGDDDDGIDTTFKYHKVIQTDALAANMAVIEQENEDLRAALRAAYLEIERQRAVIDELRAHNELEDELVIAKEAVNISETARLQAAQEIRDLQHQVETLHESHDALAAENTHLRGELVSAGITPADMDDDDDASTTGSLAEAQYLLTVFTKLTKLHVSITDHGAVRCAQHLDDDGGIVVFELTPFTNSHHVDRRQTLTNNRRETLARAAQNDAFQFDPISAPDWCPPFKSLTFPQENAAELYRFLLTQINEAVAAASAAAGQQ